MDSRAPAVAAATARGAAHVTARRVCKPVQCVMKLGNREADQRGSGGLISATVGDGRWRSRYHSSKASGSIGRAMKYP